MEYVYILIDTTFNSVIGWNRNKEALVTFAEKRGLREFKIKKIIEL